MTNHLSCDFIQEFKKHLSNMEVIEKLRLDINSIHLSPGPLKGDFYPSDVTYKASVADTHGNLSAFLLVSNPNGKMQVEQNVQRALRARQALGERLNWAVEPPIIRGFFNGISWALFHINYPLSHGRIKWILQRNLLGPAILKWLAGVLKKSWKKLPEQNIFTLFTDPLKTMVNDGDFSTDIRKCASNALDSLESGLWNPSVCLSHNDLWKGNIMVPLSYPDDLIKHDRGKLQSGSFRVIDWAGSSVEGIPFFDLIKFCRSFQLPVYYTRKAVSTHCGILDCSMREARFYLIAALALLGQNLDQFPRSAYLDLSYNLFNHMTAMGRF